MSSTFQDINIPGHQHFRASNTMSASGADNVVSQTNVLELNVDCWDELFEWLTLSDLKALRRTCKGLKPIVDRHIQRTYANGFGTLPIVCNYNQNTFNNLRRFLPSLRQLYGQMIFFIQCSISGKVFHNIKPFLSSVDMIFINVGHNFESIKNVFQLCTNLKYLQITDRSLQYIGDELMSCNFPSLDRFVFRCWSASSMNIPKLQSFFELNPTIRRFATYGNFLVKNANWIKESTIQLDVLDVEFALERNTIIEQACGLLNILFEKGFFKQLNLFLSIGCNQANMNAIASLNGLDKIYFSRKAAVSFVKTPMPQLNELCVEKDKCTNTKTSIDDRLDALVESFINVERIHFEIASFKSILPFIRHSAKLKKVKIQTPTDDGNYFNKGVVNLPALDRERKKCAGASKMTIFVNESFYLQTKAAFMKTELSLVELKRAESIDWELRF